MNVPLLDLKPQLAQLRPQIMEAVTRVVDSTGYILGREVNDLEERIAAYCGAACGIGVSSGTDALLVSLMSLDIGPGDLVLTTPYTFVATMGTVLRVGARPVFVDVEAASLNMDPERMAEALAADRKNGARIKAVIPVHLYGQCADMDRIGRLASLNAQLGQVSREVGIYRDISSAPGEKLVGLKVQREELLSRYRADARPVQELDAQIAQLEAGMAAGRTLGEGAKRIGVNPVFQTLQTEKIQLTSEVGALRRSQAELAERIALLEAEIARVKAHRDKAAAHRAAADALFGGKGGG